MKRILIAVAMAVFAISTMQARPAHAGMKGRLAVGLAIGALGVMAHQHRYEKRKWKKKHYHARRKAAKKKVYTAKKSTPKVEKVAKAEPAPMPEVPEQNLTDVAVENENSSISTAALAPIEETAAVDEAGSTPVNFTEEASESEPAPVQETAKKLDCKKFFPAVGMTLSVPCE